MKKSSLKILIFDGSYKTTAFINRLAAGLAERHEVYIAGFNEELPTRLPNVNYLALGSNQNKLRFVIVSLRYAVGSGSIKSIFTTIKKLFKGGRSQLQQQNLRFVLQKI